MLSVRCWLVTKYLDWNACVHCPVAGVNGGDCAQWVLSVITVPINIPTSAGQFWHRYSWFSQYWWKTPKRTEHLLLPSHLRIYYVWHTLSKHKIWTLIQNNNHWHAAQRIFANFADKPILHTTEYCATSCYMDVIIDKHYSPHSPPSSTFPNYRKSLM